MSEVLNLVSHPVVLNSSLVDERQPCYYANSERQGDKVKWDIGIDYRNDSSECSIVVPNLPKNTSLDFACTLILKYRNGGKKAVDLWLKNEHA